MRSLTCFCGVMQISVTLYTTCWQSFSWQLLGKVQLDLFSGYLFVTRGCPLTTNVAKDPLSLKRAEDMLENSCFLLRSHSIISVTATFCPVFYNSIFFPAFPAATQWKEYIKNERNHIDVNICPLLNTRSSPLVSRWHAKGKENLPRKSFDPESNLLWTKPEYTTLPTQLYLQWAFSMSGEKLEWEEETGGRKNRVLHASWVSFFLHSSMILGQGGRRYCFFPSGRYPETTVNTYK